VIRMNLKAEPKLPIRDREGASPWMKTLCTWGEGFRPAAGLPPVAERPSASCVPVGAVTKPNCSMLIKVDELTAFQLPLLG
jgi:hypothetical protein